MRFQMIRSVVVMLVAVVTMMSSGCSLLKFKTETPQINDRVLILGPEVAAFCGGHVEIWARVDTSAWKRSVQLFVKGLPATGASWTIANDHLMVELPKEQTSRRRRLRDIKQLEFDNSTKLDVPSDSGNVGEWKLGVEGLDPELGLKVFLKPFEGCPKNQKNILSLTLKDAEVVEL